MRKPGIPLNTAGPSLKPAFCLREATIMLVDPTTITLIPSLTLEPTATRRRVRRLDLTSTFERRRRSHADGDAAR
jgi:hypothetical protein